MTILLGIAAFILGTAIGSFLNVVIIRYAHQEPITGRSHCPACNKTLVWYELLPVVSFIALRGRCSQCSVSLSWQYPLVEVATGILFVGAYLSVLPFFLTGVVPFGVHFAYLALVLSLLVLITVYDLRHKIVPNIWSYTFAAVAFLGLFISFRDVSFIIPSWIDLLAGPLLFAPFFTLWFVSRGRWIGLGDGKLALGIGWFLGLWDGISALLIAFWGGALVGIALMIVTHILSKTRLFQGSNTITMRTEVPFAPFLILGLLLVYFFHINVLGF